MKNNNKSKYGKLIKDTLIFALGNLGSKAVLFFLVPLYTNYLTTEQYGTSDFVFTVAQLIIPFVSLVIFDAVLRYGLSRNEIKENVLKTSLIVVLFGTIATIAITPLLILYEPLSEWRWFLCIYIILNMYNNVLLNYLKIIDKNKSYAIISIVSTTVLAASNVFLLIYKNMGVSGYLLSTILASATTSILTSFSAKVISTLRNGRINKKLLLRMIKYSSPLILNNISWWVIQSSDKIMIEAMVGMAALGLYTAATKIPSLINVIISIFSQAWGISSIKEYESTKDIKFYSNIFIAYSAIAFGITIIINSIVKYFMNIYVSEEYYEAWKFVPLLLISASFSAVASYFGSLYGAMKKSTNNMKSTLCAAIINIIINYIFIQSVGIWGAIIGTVIAYIVLALYRMIDVLRFIKLNNIWLRFILNSVVALTQSILISLDYHILLISTLSIISYLIINRDLIKKAAQRIMHSITKRRNGNEKTIIG